MFLNLQKDRSQKLSMLEENKERFGICIEFGTKLHKAIFNFQVNFFLLQVKGPKKHIFENTEKKFRKKINKTNIKNRFV